RASRSTTGHTVTIVGAFDPVDSEYVTIKAHNLIAQVTIGDLEIVGPNADPMRAGKGSYAVHASSASQLTLARVGLTAGNAASGLRGADGLVAVNVSPTVGMPGAPGGPSNEFVSTCDDSTHTVGAAGGTNSCGGGVNPNGGAGGDGGRM